jgi:hypothetical protein
MIHKKRGCLTRKYMGAVLFVKFNDNHFYSSFNMRKMVSTTLDKMTYSHHKVELFL